MLKPLLLVLFVAVLLQACADVPDAGSVAKTDTSGKMALDTSQVDVWVYKAEQDRLAMKKLICRELALYDIEKDTLDYELRLWEFPSMWDPSILYILKRKDSLWTLFHYQYYTLLATDPAHYYTNPVVDSIVMETVKPQKISWTTYVNNLQLDSLWSLKTESAIKDKEFGMNDGYRVLLEFNAKGKYKYLCYTAPNYFQNRDSNHKRFEEFRGRLVGPVIYKGMRNP